MIRTSIDPSMPFGSFVAVDQAATNGLLTAGMQPLYLPRGLVNLTAQIGAAARTQVESLIGVLSIRCFGTAAVAKSLAIRSAARGDYQGALEWWKKVELCRPDWSIAVAGQARVLRSLNRLDDAQRTLQAGLVRFPDDPLLIVDLGWLLLARNEFQEALPLWHHSVVIAGDRPDCHVGLATTLRQMLRFDEADAMLLEATRLFPTSCFALSNHAVNADVRGDRDEALLRWQRVMERFPLEPIAYAGHGAALKALGLFSEADTILMRGASLFPNDSNVAINHAWVAVAAAEWGEAMRRWSKLRSKWPNDERIRAGLSEATMRTRLAAADEEVAEAAPSAARPPAKASDEVARRELIMCFESIGENCELGFVQRHFDAEPLGLFRWAGISYANLLDALDKEFAGIGTDENTILAVNPNNREFFTEDRRYGMSLHSFVLEGDADATAVKIKLCRRINYLKTKILDDLQHSDKVFVFNTAWPLADDDLRRLHAGLSRYQPVSLLHVAPHVDLPPGGVAEVDARLWRGSLGRTGYNGRVWDIEFDSWLAICRTVKGQNSASTQTPA